MKHPHRIGSALALLLAASSSQAADWAGWSKFDAFGTLGAHSADDAVASLRAEPRTATSSLKQLRLDGDSQLTGQITVNPTGPLRAVWQVLATFQLQAQAA